MKKKDSSDFPEAKKKKDDFGKDDELEVPKTRTEKFVEDHKRYQTKYTTDKVTPTQAIWQPRVIETLQDRLDYETSYEDDPKKLTTLGDDGKPKGGDGKTLYDWRDLENEGLQYPSDFLRAFATKVSERVVKLDKVEPILDYLMDDDRPYVKIREIKTKKGKVVKRISLTKLGRDYQKEKEDSQANGSLGVYWDYQAKSCSPGSIRGNQEQFR